ncbi:hypothetical protein [Halobellus limi]|uniref:Uncharacterized protein n=1 Tax=Halobellus limi TaxID=699433 RepID=A0A4D6H3W7_9EURY|nr:hypothetical protein [Halobellus limi]QCC48271.1 hypothetical protein DV707_11700 [Halobellus limi]
MTDCQSAASEPSPESVRRSLRALAEGSAPRGPSPDPASARHDPERLRAVVEDAERAVSCAAAASAFLLDGRLATLGDAVTTAERCGHEQVARRGRRARAILRDLDTAVSGRDSEIGPSGGGPEAEPSGGDPEAEPSGRGTDAVAIGTARL